jgi:RibD C-terminal domain
VTSVVSAASMVFPSYKTPAWSSAKTRPISSMASTESWSPSLPIENGLVFSSLPRSASVSVVAAVSVQRRGLRPVDQVRADSDAILVGAGTLRADNPRMMVKSEPRRTARAARGEPENPLNVTVHPQRVSLSRHGHVLSPSRGSQVS